MRVRHLRQRQKFAIKKVEFMQEQEKKNLVEKQEKQKAQMAQMQALEASQQKKHADMENKKRYRDFRTEQKAALQSGQKLSSAERSARLKEFTDRIAAEAKDAERALLERHKRMREEQQLTHAKFQRILQDDHDGIKQHLESQHAARLTKLRQDLARVEGVRRIQNAKELSAMWTVHFERVRQIKLKEHSILKELVLVHIKVSIKVQ